MIIDLWFGKLEAEGQTPGKVWGREKDGPCTEGLCLLLRELRGAEVGSEVGELQWPVGPKKAGDGFFLDQEQPWRGC